MTHGIHPPTLAAMNVKNAGKKYRPSNGTEGDSFLHRWCIRCERDKSLCSDKDFDDSDEGERCEILNRTFLHDVDHPEYPTEWQYGKDGQPICAAFVLKGDEIPTVRCDRTVDMFEEKP